MRNVQVIKNESADMKMADSAQAPLIERDAYSIQEFCRRHSISHGTYYNMKNAGKGPREGHVLGRVLITKEAALAWRRKIEEVSPVA
jgi:hypothetical protein